MDFIFYFLGGKALRIASGTTKLLNDDLINVLDPDSTKAEISITLVPASGKILLIFSPTPVELERCGISQAGYAVRALIAS